MADSIMSYVAEYYRTRHELVLKLVEGLDDRQIAWRPNLTTPSIGFHVWHLARWADYLQAMLTGADAEVWAQGGLAAQWGFASVNLGFAETGMGMDDEVSASLPFPAKAVLLDYARQAFAQADQAVAALGDDGFQRRIQDRRGAEWAESVAGDAVLSWLVHDSRHLGMIECMLGALGLHGTATR